LWIHADSYFAFRIESASYVSLPQLLPESKVIVIDEWQLTPLQEAFIVGIPEGITPQPTPSGEDVVSTPFGTMRLYRGQRVPATIQYPADWVVTPESSPPSYPLTLRRSMTTASQLTITEPTFKEMGLSTMSLDEYSDQVVSVNTKNSPDVKVISQTYTNVSDDAKAKVIVFSAESGKRILHRLIYVHDGNQVFNLTYSSRPSIEDISQLVDYSFGTFKLAR
jgi:hypothetical protein